MIFGSRLFALSATMLALSLSPVPVFAQAARTWVSGLGDDTHPCSRTSPCKTFTGALAKTVAGGEISVLDSGGFSPVTINKSISIMNAGGAEASILTAGGNAITVNAGPQDVVRIRGLVLDGAGGNPKGSSSGIHFQSGGELHVENCIIKNFQLASAGYGIDFAPSASAILYVTDTILVHNVNGNAGGGIHIAPTNNGIVTAILSRVQSYSNGFGLKVSGLTSTGTINVTVRDSMMSTNSAGIWAVTASAFATISVEAERNLIVSNSINGVAMDGGKAAIALSGNAITTNLYGVTSQNGGLLYSYKNNNINGNQTNGTIPPGNVLSLN